MFETVSEAAEDEKFSQLQARFLVKREKVIKYSNRLSELVSDTESTGHAITKLEQKRALLRCLPSDLDVKVEVIMGSEGNYQQAVAKLLVEEMLLLEKNNTAE